MKVVFIRHGHAKHNEGFALIGEDAYFSENYVNAPLTELGEKQTRSLVAPYVDRIYVSPLLRCIQTARNIFGQDAVLHLHDGLMETQGKHPVNRRQQKDELAMYSSTNLECVKDSCEWTEETPVDVKIRSEKALIDIFKRSAGCNSIAVVTHHDWLLEALGKKFSNAEMFITTA
jgi:broad specificity phosphatase PhoE